eukprot:5491881-Prymnesium_polylepis.1
MLAIMLAATSLGLVRTTARRPNLIRARALCPRTDAQRAAHAACDTSARSHRLSAAASNAGHRVQPRRPRTRSARS